MDGLDEVKKLLEEYNQSHVLKYWNDLDEEQQKEFLRKLKNIDFKAAVGTWQKAHEDQEKNESLTEADIKPIDVQVEKDLPHSVIEEYRNAGLEEISKGTVAVIVLAGGQGTRLGLPYPKGMCATKIPSGKTLFQLQAERILRLMEIAKEKTGREGVIQWYLMTSEATDVLTHKFLQQNKYFDLKPENVKLFKQAQIPCFDLEGKILLEEKDEIAMTPDGNGGIYRALKNNDIFEDMEKKGVKYVHVHSVDNILIKVADPVFIGKCVKDNIDCGLKVIRKTDPTEPLGIVVKVLGKFQVVEYSEIPNNAANMKNAPGDDLLFKNGNICNHFFTVEFLKKVSTEHDQDLKLHLAKKTTTQLGPEGDKIRPSTHNCIKIEKFIFDVIEYSENILVWQIERSHEFSPVKNSDVCQKDCLTTARRDLLALHKRWVENMGGKCQGAGVEVSPLLSYEGENLGKVKGREYSEDDVILSEKEEKQQERRS